MGLSLKNWTIEEQTGYKPLTTFYTDFSIADKFGQEAILDTYRRAFSSWKSDFRYITELTMVLNWKCWEHYEADSILLSKLYSELYYKLDAWCLDNLVGEELNYYIQTTD